MSDPTEAEMMKKAISWLSHELDNPYNDWSYIENVDEIRRILHLLNRREDA